MTVARTFIQLSTRSWQGVPDFSISLLENGDPFFALTLRVAQNLAAPIVLLTPSWDAGHTLLRETYERVVGATLRQFAGLDSSPLLRLVEACDDLPGEAYVVRMNALNAFIDLQEVFALTENTRASGADAGLFEDDIPPQFTLDVFRVEALRKAAHALDPLSPLQIHARQAVAQATGARIYRAPVRTPSDAELRQARAANEALYRLAHLDYDEGLAVPAGDQLGFHYDLAIAAMAETSLGPQRALDIACGVGFGTARLARAGHMVIGADIDAEVLAEAERVYGTSSALAWMHIDGEATPFETAHFDAICSFETLEHVANPPDFLQELRRILKPGGQLFLSVPQNRFGHIPLNPQHEREYLAADLAVLLGQSFEHVALRGIKQGRIIVEGDPIGANSYATCC